MLHIEDNVTILGFEGKVRIHYYVDFEHHMETCNEIAKKFNCKNLSEVVEKYKLKDRFKPDRYCIFPEANTLYDLEYFINFLNQKPNIEKPISIF